MSFLNCFWIIFEWNFINTFMKCFQQLNLFLFIITSKKSSKPSLLLSCKKKMPSFSRNIWFMFIFLFTFFFELFLILLFLVLLRYISQEKSSGKQLCIVSSITSVVFVKNLYPILQRFFLLAKVSRKLLVWQKALIKNLECFLHVWLQMWWKTHVHELFLMLSLKSISWHCTTILIFSSNKGSLTTLLLISFKKLAF